MITSDASPISLGTVCPKVLRTGWFEDEESGPLYEPDLVIRDPEGAKWPSKRALPAAERSRWCAIADATDRAPEDRFRAACGDRRDHRARLADVDTCLSSLSLLRSFRVQIVSASAPVAAVSGTETGRC
jgi:hypothetical protein